MGKKRWLIPLSVAAVLAAALAVPLMSLTAALAVTGDTTKTDSRLFNDEVAFMTIDMDVLTPTVMPGGQVQYTINVSNIGGILQRGLGNLPECGSSLSAAINVSIWAELPAFFTYASTGTIIEDGATRSSTDPSPGDTQPLWGYWNFQMGGSVLIPFTANVLCGIPPGTYDANAFADGDNFDEINDDGPLGQDDDTPPGEDPEPDEDVTVGRTVGGIVEPVDPLELAATPGEPSDGASMVASLAVGIGVVVLLAAFLVWTLRRERGIRAGKSQ